MEQRNKKRNLGLSLAQAEQRTLRNNEGKKLVELDENSQEKDEPYGASGKAKEANRRAYHPEETALLETAKKRLTRKQKSKT